MENRYLCEHEQRFGAPARRASYIGSPVSGTVLYAVRKLDALLPNLEHAEKCLVFVETGADVRNEWKQRHLVIECEDPAACYSQVAKAIWEKRQAEEAALRYITLDNGAVVSESAVIGAGTLLEPLCFVGHHVEIGSGCLVMSGARVKAATVGDGCVIMENAVVGAAGYNFAGKESPDRIWGLGGVILRDGVDIGPGAVVHRGSTSDTDLGKNTKVGAGALIGHDVHCGEEVRIYSCAKIAGFVTLGSGSVIALDAVVKNRIRIGEGAFVAISSVVYESVPDRCKVAGNPAKAYDAGEADCLPGARGGAGAPLPGSAAAGQEALLSLLRDLFPGARVSPETDLVKDGPMDSLGIVTLVGAISDRWQVELPYQEISADNFRDLGSIARLVDRCRQVAACGPPSGPGTRD